MEASMSSAEGAAMQVSYCALEALTPRHDGNETRPPPLRQRR